MKKGDLQMKKFLKKNEVFGVDLKDRRMAYIWLDKLAGAETFSIGTSDIQPGSQSIAHQHAVETEVMFIYRGTGTGVIDGLNYPLEPETMMFCPPGLPHQIQNTGQEMLSFIFFYIPGGPEQYLRKL
jgi:mannose-6-phosphate isomerase-like protein (cupin superfamily)